MKKLKLSEEQLVQLIERTINEQGALKPHNPLRGMDDKQVIDYLYRKLDDIQEYSRTLEQFVRIQKDKIKRNDVHIEYGKGRDRRGSVGQFRNTVERLNSTADEYIVTLQAYEEAESKGYDWGKDIHEQKTSDGVKVPNAFERQIVDIWSEIKGSRNNVQSKLDKILEILRNK